MKLGSVLAFSALPALVTLSCAATVPRAELNRCTLGVADGNDAMTMRQGAACTMVAKRLAADEQPVPALGYARKACDLEDPRGCEEYLALVRGQSARLGSEEVQRARAAGEKACSGMVVAVDGATDARPMLCARTAELYQDVEPRSREDAGRLFASACKLGDDESCRRARAGVDPSDHVVLGPKARPNAPNVAQALPPPVPHFVSGVTPAPPPPCHEMRTCVTLDVEQRNMTEIGGSITNHCERAVTCNWCPSHQNQVDRSGCHVATLAPGEARAGRDAGLWYEGFDSMAYDCMDATDVKGCLGL